MYRSNNGSRRDGRPAPKRRSAIMNHLMSATAVVALLALSIPAGAQAPATSSSPNTAAPSQVATPAPAVVPQTSTSAGQAPSPSAAQSYERMPRRHGMGAMGGHGRLHAAREMHHGMGHGMHRGGMMRRGGQASDNVADQLNAQELHRSGGSMPMQGMPMQGGMMPQGGMPMHGGMPMQHGAPAPSPSQPGSAPSGIPMR